MLLYWQTQRLHISMHIIHNMYVPTLIQTCYVVIYGVYVFIYTCISYITCMFLYLYKHAMFSSMVCMYMVVWPCNQLGEYFHLRCVCMHLHLELMFKLALLHPFLWYHLPIIIISGWHRAWSGNFWPNFCVWWSYTLSRVSYKR